MANSRALARGVTVLAVRIALNYTGGAIVRPPGRVVPQTRTRGVRIMTMTMRLARHRWLLVLGVLCGLAASSLAFSAGPAASSSSGWCQQPPGFSFDESGKKRFQLNTLCTTPYPPDTPDTPAWADVLVAAKNFVACKGSPIALCYYSGPETSPAGTDPTPCKLREGGAIADCTCFEIPPGSTYFVDINAILNLGVYLETVIACGRDGGECLPAGGKVAPVCEAIRTGTLFPGKQVDLISTFSFALEQKIPIAVQNNACVTEPYTRYAGCMTAPCKRTDVIDSVTGNFLAQCACPTYVGPFQVGTDLAGTPGCQLPDDTVWSAAYSTFGGTFPTVPDCIPDALGANGCPLLSPDPPDIPAPPAQISCNTVCSEYYKSSNKGVQVGFTCDATLCTGAADPDLVAKACAGLDKHGVSEILKLEMAVGKSCAASQICGCQPNKKTNEEIWRLNAAQRSQGIEPQCDQNGTLCGSKPR
ncbi:MAG: hypothetical protein KDI53_14875 [Candidatus Accumulibacter sp.]|nr:hypothetical protein [Accumulibacter sp.]